MFNNRCIGAKIIPSSASLQFVRLVRTKLGNKKGLAPNVVRLVTQLSVISASRKQPKLLKLCQEDLIKHEVITKLWSLLKKREQEETKLQLQKQELLIKEANEELLKVNETIYNKLAGEKNFGTRFSLELRIPTKYPPRKIWNYDDIKTV